MIECQFEQSNLIFRSPKVYCLLPFFSSLRFGHEVVKFSSFAKKKQETQD